MSEKETPESVEVEAQEEITEVGEEVVAQASEEEASSSDEESQDEVELSPEGVEESTPGPTSAKKGLMQRRPDYSQSSVPNAHRGYSGTPPIIMLLIISVFLLLSIIFRHLGCY